MKSSLLWILLLLISTSAYAQPIDKKRLADFDKYVDQVRKQWDVPGMSIVVVKNGAVVFKKGYGVIEAGTSKGVDTQTLFANASTTKAMTAIVMGMLVDEGKINWDDAVSEYLPELQLSDPAVTRELRVRDLFLHNTGYPSTNFLTGLYNISPDAMFQKLRYVQPQYSFRGGFEYQNTFYTVAGRVMEKVTGKRWFELMNEKLFTPLGMTTTVPRRTLSKSANMTRPHLLVRDTIRALSYDTDSEIGAAGGVWSNADDMSIWMNCLLDSGRHNGKRIISEKTWLELFRPQNMFPENEYPVLSLVKPNWRTYSLGWYQIDYKGRKLNFHTGSLEGLTAIVGLLPEEKAGVFIYGNYDHAEVRHALLYKTLDYFFLGGTRDWNREVTMLFDNIKAKGQAYEKSVTDSRVVQTKPSLALEAYAGTYTSDLYGTLKVTVSNNQLVCDINDHAVDITMSHWHFNTFVGGLGEFKQYRVLTDFVLDARGNPETVLLAGDYEFRRKKE